MTEPAAFPAVALDVGEARIGLAASDADGRFAFGRGYHARGTGRAGLAADIDAIRALADREGARVVVIGLPLRTDGADSPQTARVRKFARELERAGLRVALQDERFTTRLATQGLASASRARRQEKGLTDEASAIAILETYLRRAQRAGS